MTTATVSQRESTLALAVREALGDLLEIPDHEADPDVYLDYGDATEFKVKLGKGECAA